ncbi:MAG: AAA domain-containing protein [Gaiellaceae bacterium]
MNSAFRGCGLSNPIAWDHNHFDLLVIDEASQLSLPAAVLAGAPLKEDGQAVVVGDHRQMPPIFSHDWKHEPRRGAQDTMIDASTFESLRDRGFASVALDQSFRLHAMHVRFLDVHVHAADGVGYFSELDRLLPEFEGGTEFARAVLAPEYPVVVIEHAEHRR